MPGTPLNLGGDPFMAGPAFAPQGAPAYGAAGGSNVNLAGDPFLDDAMRSGKIGGGHPQMQYQKQQKEPTMLEVSIRMAEGLPPPTKNARKAFPVCVCQVKGKPRVRVQTGNCTNMSMTDPVWGKSPEYFRTFLQGWEEGDTLTFTVQDDDATSSKIIGMKDLTYQEYTNGYEWWLKLDVAKMKRYPEGWPYAAVQIKVQKVQAVKLTPADPWMSGLEGEVEKTGGCCYNYCYNKCFDHCCNYCCFLSRMWCCRRCNVCCLWAWVNTKWSCLMCCLGCSFGCLECCTLCTMTWDWCTGKESLNDLRRQCSKRFKLPDAEDNADEERDTACCCIPLRTACFIMGIISALKACIAWFYPALLESPMGYSMISRVLVGATEVTGIFFGSVGAIGAFELSVSLLNVYNYYQFARLASMFFMIYTDIPLLYDCNTWRTDLKGAIKEYGWNPMMYDVAMGNDCLPAQINFVIAAILQLCIYVYLISLTRRLIWDTEKTPRYLLALPSSRPDGAFVNHSRTQGKAKPPYGALLGNDGPQNHVGYLETAQKVDQPPQLVGNPVMAPGGPPTMPSGFRY